jgi:ABC-type sulfate transport system permease subunit
MLSNQPPDKTRPILIAIAIGYLALILLAPAVNVFWQAFNQGLGPFFHTFAQADFTSSPVSSCRLIRCLGYVRPGRSRGIGFGVGPL